jgi:CRISPR system Cascade subunit CasE
MYLTRAFLDPLRGGALRLVANPQAMHAAILRGMPTQPVPAAAPGAPRVLWRLDADDPRRPILWLLSPEKPDLTALMQVAGAPGNGVPSWESREYTPLLTGLSAGQRFAFRLTANPTRSVRVPHASDTRRVEHVTAEHQVRWLVERAERCGFRILTSDVMLPDRAEPALELRLRSREKVRFRRGGVQGRQVTVVRVGYEGALEVVDPDAMRSALTSGIGHARAYGCGLLTLARLPGRCNGVVEGRGA